MRLMITGGAGYIGSVTTELLLNYGHEVTVLDNLSRGHARAVDRRVRFQHADLSDVRALDRLFSTNRFDAVMHFAAHSLVGESVSDPLKYYAGNLGGGAVLLQKMVAHGVRNFIFSSTAAIFGSPEKMPINEEEEKKPTNPYGRTKLYFEHLLEDCDAAYGLKSVCLRYFNAAGASERFGEDHDPETHLIPIVLQTAAGQRPAVQLYGDDYPTRDGSCIRDYIHVEDLAQAHLLALEHLMKTSASTAFNLGNGKGYTVREVIAAAEKVTGKQIRVETAPRREGDPPVLVASSEKIQRELNWVPRFRELEQIIGSAWEWMQRHPHGYR